MPTRPTADLFGNVKELGPLNSNTTKIGVIHNDALPTLDMTNPNAQVDLRRAWLDTEREGATNHDWLYFAWERDTNTGSGFIAYEFMQNPVAGGCAYDTATEAQLIANCNPWANRKAGDFMILWDQQGGSKDLYLRTWSGTGAQPDPRSADAARRRRLPGRLQLRRLPRRGRRRPDGDHLRRIHRLSDVRQHHPEHGHRELRHRGLQGHHPETPRRSATAPRRR